MTPDVNMAVLTYRNMLNRGVVDRNPILINTAISGINGCMDSELKLKFAPKVECDKINKIKKFLLCTNCSQEISYDNPKTFHLPLSIRNAKLLNVKLTRKYVICEECDIRIYSDDPKVNIIIELSDIFATESLIPVPPRIMGIIDSVYNSGIYWEWVDFVISVIEDRLRKFREKYATKQKEGSESGAEAVIGDNIEY